MPGPERVLRLVKQAVTETGTDQRTDQQGEEERIQDFLVKFLVVEELDEHPVSQDESGHEQEAVPPYGEAPYPEYFRIHVPVYEKQVHR